VNYDNSLVVTITVTCYSWAPRPFIYMWRHLLAATHGPGLNPTGSRLKLILAGQD